MAYLIKENQKSTTVRSYVSAIKAVLTDINIPVNEDTYLLNSLTHACRLMKDSFTTRLPIQCDMLNLVLKTTYRHHLGAGQLYIAHLYLALFSTAYYGLFRVGELTESDHVIKVCNIHIGSNKNKILFTLKSSKTCGKHTFPQTMKISSLANSSSTYLCPFEILRMYLSLRLHALHHEENFFIFGNRTPVAPHHFRSMLKAMIQMAGINAQPYSTHSLRAGRAMDLLKLGLSVETIKKLGWWKSNAVYTYLK